MIDPKYQLESLAVFDEVETIKDCTVQILTNSVTGEQSIGWWRNDKPPVGYGKDDEQ